MLMFIGGMLAGMVLLVGGLYLAAATMFFFDIGPGEPHKGI